MTCIGDLCGPCPLPVGPQPGWLGGAEALVAIMLGFTSAVVDNVPLVAAAQGMYDLNDHPVTSWENLKDIQGFKRLMIGW